VVGAVAGTVVPELEVTRLSPELVVGRAITTANMARRTTAAAAPSNGAGLASAAVISRAIRPSAAPRRHRSTRGVSSVMTPVSKPSLESRSSRVGLGKCLNDGPIAAAISATEAIRCSGRFTMAQVTVPKRS
jgi:hypothetical protein